MKFVPGADPAETSRDMGRDRSSGALRLRAAGAAGG